MLKRLPQSGSVFAQNAVWCSRWSTSVSGPVFATTSRHGTGSVEIRCWAARPPASVGNPAAPHANDHHAGAEIVHSDDITVNLDYRQMGVGGDDSWGGYEDASLKPLVP
jgi:hypothetical protein